MTSLPRSSRDPQPQTGDLMLDTRVLSGDRGALDAGARLVALGTIQPLLLRQVAAGQITVVRGRDDALLIGVPDGYGRTTWHALCLTCGAVSLAARTLLDVHERGCVLCTAPTVAHAKLASLNASDLIARLVHVDTVAEIRGRHTRTQSGQAGRA